MKTLLYILGTRPEAVKMCPLIRTIKNRNICHNTVFLTGQHGRAASEVLDFFEVAADITSEAVHAPSLYMLTDELFRRAEKTLAETNPDYVAVHGDTASAFTGAMAAFYRKIPILHIEAGLRTYRKYMPYPEEFFRRAIAAMAEYHFAPTEEARRHLLSEGVADDRIFMTGNTIRDAIDYGAGKSHIHCPEKPYALLTVHRRENRGEPMERIFSAIAGIAGAMPELRIVYPVHPNPAVGRAAAAAFMHIPSVTLLSPLPFYDFHALLKEALCVFTDSGGVQEEAAAFGVPAIVLRDETEREEEKKNGALYLVGSDSGKIMDAFFKVYRHRDDNRMPCLYESSPSEKIADILENMFKCKL